MSIILGFLLGAFMGYVMAKSMLAIKDVISKDALSKMMLFARFSTAVAVLDFLAFHIREICFRVAVFLSDYLGVWLVSTNGEWLHQLAGYVGDTAKALYDLGAYLHEVPPTLQMLSIIVLVQMLVFMYFTRDIRRFQRMQ